MQQAHIIMIMLASTILLQWICIGIIVCFSGKIAHRKKTDKTEPEYKPKSKPLEDKSQEGKHDKKIDDILETITISVIDPIFDAFEKQIQTLFANKQNEISSIYDYHDLTNQERNKNDPKLIEASAYQNGLIDAKLILQDVMRDVTRKQILAEMKKPANRLEK